MVLSFEVGNFIFNSFNEGIIMYMEILACLVFYKIWLKKYLLNSVKKENG